MDTRVAVWDHVMTGRATYAIRRDGTEVAMLSLLDEIDAHRTVREVVAVFANTHGGTVHARSKLEVQAQ